MSKMMNEVKGAAKDGAASVKEATEHALESAKGGLESAKEGTKHTFSSVVSTLATGISAVAGLAATLRRLDADTGLSWFGLSRRRSPLLDVALFGSGMAVGAGLGVLFAPMAGTELRATILARFKGAASAEPEKKPDLGGDAKEAVKRAARPVEVPGPAKHVS